MTTEYQIGDPSMPPPHRIRVQNEAAELDIKLDKLSAFIESALFDQLDEAEQDLLVQQQVAMVNYHEALCQRIARWSAGEAPEPDPKLHLVVGGPAPEPDDFVPEEGSPAPRASILKLLGEDRLTLLEPGAVYDRHIIGVTTGAGDKLAVVYNEQGVCASMAIHQQIDLMEAWDAVNAKRNQIGPNGELPPVFMTDIADVMLGGI